MTPAITAMRDWLRTCPLVASAQEDGVEFKVSYLDPRTEQYSISDMPSDPILKRYFSGTRRLKNYVLASRSAYSEDSAQQADHSGMWDALTDWVEAQNDAKNFPKLDGGRTVLGVRVSSSGTILEASDNTCRAQVQIQLVYYQPKGATK